MIVFHPKKFHFDFCISQFPLPLPSQKTGVVLYLYSFDPSQFVLSRGEEGSGLTKDKVAKSLQKLATLAQLVEQLICNQ